MYSDVGIDVEWLVMLLLAIKKNYKKIFVLAQIALETIKQARKCFANKLFFIADHKLTFAFGFI